MCPGSPLQQQEAMAVPEQSWVLIPPPRDLKTSRGRGKAGPRVSCILLSAAGVVNGGRGKTYQGDFSNWSVKWYWFGLSIDLEPSFLYMVSFFNNSFDYMTELQERCSDIWYCINCYGVRSFLSSCSIFSLPLSKRLVNSIPVLLINDKKSGNSFFVFPSDAGYASVISNVGVHVGKNRLQRLLIRSLLVGISNALWVRWYLK